jgi:hypothetical protein
MQSHAHWQRSPSGPALGVRQGALCLGCGCQRTKHGREGDEKGVALRIHLHPAMRDAGPAYQPLVFGLQHGIAFTAQLLQPLGGVLDVGEEKGDSAGRQVRP